MPVWSIVLLTILVILLVVFIALIIVGNKLRKKQESQQEQIDAAKQIMSMLVIDKKKMKLKEAGLPKMVLDQTPKYLRGSKMPIVKAKIGPRVMTLMCDPKVFEQIPVKAEIKAEVSGIYITGIKSVRGGKIVVEEKKKKNQPKWLLIMYPLLSLIAGSLTITSILSILPIISSTLASTMLMTKNMKTSRKINLVSSVLALPYLITNKAYVAAIIFSASFINTLEAIYKIDYKKANNNTKTTNTENQEKEIANNKAMVPSQNITHNKNISKPKTKKLILKKKE